MGINNIYQSIVEKKKIGKKSFGVLIDPDNADGQSISNIIKCSQKHQVDYFLVGGSLVITDKIDNCIEQLKNESNIPVLLFPGSPLQVSKKADALLYLSLISGRNPELLIGQHVLSAPFVKKSGLEVIPTGYIVVDGGVPTTVSYMSNATPIPANKNDIAMCTAMAGEMLGMKLIYMDAGSGAKTPITELMIETVANNIDCPLFVGGGINTPEKAFLNCKAGADVIVVGNAIEKDEQLISQISEAITKASN